MRSWLHRSAVPLHFGFFPGRWVVMILLVAAVGCRPWGTVPVGKPPAQASVKVAVVHFAPSLGDVPANRQELVRLTEEAAGNGAKIVVHTEMATSGYSFFSREEISRVAETVPGPTTKALGEVAARHRIYVAVGLPVFEARTRLFYNSAVLIDPRGHVAGVYHKRNNLLEASYNAEEFGSIPTFDTPYGRLSIVICADLFYSQFPRLAALAGTDILLAPSNTGLSTSFLQVRTFEDSFALLVANRYGSETQGSPRHVFDQNTFTIPSPYTYDFNFGSRSVVVARDGAVLVDIPEKQTTIGYAELPLRIPRTLPVVRRPDLYSLMGQDTLEPYTFTQFQLPAPATFAAAAVDPGSSDAPWQAALTAARNALSTARSKGYALKLIVYPQGFFAQPDPAGLDGLQAFSRSEEVDLVLSFGGLVPPRSLLLTPSGETYTYDRTHRGRTEPIPPERLSDRFFVIDRPYARLALLQDKDLFAPETGVVMAKMGVDLIAVNADSSVGVLSALWQSRTGDYMHLVVANRQAPEGIYLGGYKADPSFLEAEGMVVMQMSTQDVRNKKEPRFLDFLPLLEPCGNGNC